MRRMLVWMCSVFVLQIGATALPDDSTIPREKFEPGKSFTILLPKLGTSTRQSGKPVEMLVHVPVNYAPDRPHPVIAFLGGGAGSIKQSKRWFDLLEKRNFIVFAVDYTAPLPRDPDFKNTVHGLDLLARSTTVDLKTVILSGESSGAYGMTTWLACENGKRFCAFVPIIGGMLMNPKVVGNRPVLHIAGEKDTQRASGGRPRVVVQRECYQKLKEGGVDVEIIIQPGVAHAWKPVSYDAARRWIYTKVPNSGLQLMHLYSELASKTRLERRKTYYYRKIAESWLETALTEEARRKISGPEK